MQGVLTGQAAGLHCVRKILRDGGGQWDLGRVDWHVELDHPKTPRLFSVLMGSDNF